MDRNRFVDIDSNGLDEFTCGICLNVFINPVVTHCCRQTFCEDCIKQWITRDNTCPIDRQMLSESHLSVVPRIVTNLLNNLKIKCDFQQNGCQSVIKLEDLTSHLLVCDFRPNRKCQICGYLIKHSSDEHNCIELIKTENKELRREVEKLNKMVNEMVSTTTTDHHLIEVLQRNNILSDEVTKLKKEREFLIRTTNMELIILEARNNLEHYKIESETNCMPGDKLNCCLEKCKEAINIFKSYEEISKYLSQYFNFKRKFNTTKRWHVFTFAKNGGESVVNCDHYFRVCFSKLIIEIFYVGKR